jgi:succinate dehydrogenase / fumarate reductase flavoprotein subunit
MMQCLADGYFILPVTIGDYLSRHEIDSLTDHAALTEGIQKAQTRVDQLLAIKGSSTSGAIHRRLGRVMWDGCGITRDRAGLEKALAQIPELRDQFWNDLRISGTGQQLNQELEHAGRLADFLEFSEVMCRDALAREESCGCHLRDEYQTPEGEAMRDDQNFSHVSVWDCSNTGDPVMQAEPLEFAALQPIQRNYKS